MCIQAVLDVQDGDAVRVKANGTYTLTGYAGSALTSLQLEVSRYAQLLKLVRTPYGYRLADKDNTGTSARLGR